MNYNPKYYNYTIVGAGASGLLLAIELAKSGMLENKTLCIIDREFNKGNDRTWCFWSTFISSDIIQNSISATWDSCSSEGKLQSIRPFKYHHIRSEDFYQNAWEYLNTFKTIFRLQGEVSTIVENSQSVHVSTEKDCIQCDILFNSIPDLKNSIQHPVRLWQSFYGWRVQFLETDRLDLDLTLMDFEIEQSNSTQFVYVLPFSDNKALIELTRFGTEALEVSTAKKILGEYINKISHKYVIEEVEVNKIPMSQIYDAKEKHHRLNSKVIPIGTPAGALKASTGYGFLKMHHHAIEIARAISHNRPFPKLYRKSRFRLYDKILLDILINKPQKGRSIFKLLFGKISTSLILKFLNEKTSLFEEAYIFSKLPKPLFIKHLYLTTLNK